MRQTQPQPQPQSQSSWSHYAKAAAVFTLTTATYLLARTTGWLPGWFRSESDDEKGALSTSIADESYFSASIPELEGDTIYTTSQHLLQQNKVIVANPVPDQLVEMGQPYQYPLDNVFSGNYTFLTVEQINRQPLSGWLSVQYKQLATVAGTFNDVAVNGNTVFLAGDFTLNYNAFLTIIDVTNASTPRILSTLANSTGLVVGNGIAISGDVAFVAVSVGLQIVDVSNLNVPRTLSVVSNNLNGTALNVVVSGATVFVAEEKGGLQIVDVSNPSAPRVLSTVPNSPNGIAYDVAVNGSIVFVADGVAGLQIVDVNDLSAPQVLSVTGGIFANAVNIAVSGDTVFVVNSFLRIVDVSNLALPRVLSTVMTNGITAVAVSGDTVFVGAGVSGLQIVNVSDLMNPRIVVTVPNNPTSGEAVGVAIIDNLVFITEFGAGLRIIDISQGNLMGIPPVTPTGQELSLLISVGDTAVSFQTDIFVLTVDQFPRLPVTTVADQSMFPGQSKTVSLQSEVLFVNPRSSFLQLTMSLLNGRVEPGWVNMIMTPTTVSTYAIITGAAYALSVSGNILFLTTNSADLQIFDVTNPNTPQILSNLPMSSFNGFAYDLAVSGDMVFVANGRGGLLIINVTNLKAPSVVSTVPNAPNGVAWNVVVNGSTVFVADGDAGLQIINVSNLSAPRVLSTVPNNPSLVGTSFSDAIAVSGNTVFEAVGDGGLQIIDVTNLTAPRVLSIVPNSPNGQTSGVVVSGSAVFVADYDYLQIVDVSNLFSPRVLSVVPCNLGGAALMIVVSGSTVFVANEYAGVQIIDVSNLNTPRVLSTVVNSLNGVAYDVAVRGNTVFVADYYAGLQIIDVSQWEIVLTPGLADVGNYALRLTAIDDLGGESYIDFTVRVEGLPQLNGSIPLQRVWVGQLFNYFIPQNLFVDPNNDVIGYSASMIGGKLLPNWLRFNPLTIGFSGVPQSSDAGNVTIILSATDHICPEIPTVNFTLSVGFLPVLSHKITNQLAPIELSYQFSVPKNSFYDPDGLALSYLAQGVNNQPLPSWLQFDSSALLFYGIANTSNITVYTLQLIATNNAGGQVIASFTLRTDHFPVFNKVLSLPIASVNQPWVWTLPSDAFTDADGDPLTYSATQEDGSGLPSWLSFNPITRTFTGVPLLVGTQGLKITAQDSYGGSNSTYFNITILSESQMGSVITPPSARAGKSFEFQVNASSIFGGKTFNCSASLIDGVSLPSWLQFISNSLSFTGLPNSSDVGSYDITLIATDSQGIQYNVSFVLNVNPNYPPQVYLPISNQVAQVGESFVFFASQKTFVDPNDDNLTYTVNPLPSWLSFDPQQLKFWGTPGRSDTDPLTAHVVNVELTAHDDESQTSTLFTISVQGTSNLLLFLQVGIPLLSGLASLYEAYQNRALLLNRCCKQRIVKSETVAITGEDFHYDFKTQPEQVGKIQVKLPKAEEEKSDMNCCGRLFRPCKDILEESPDHLPAAYPLPKWLDYYADHNRLFSKGRVPSVNHPQFTVQVLNSADVICEEVSVTVQAARV